MRSRKTKLTLGDRTHTIEIWFIDGAASRIDAIITADATGLFDPIDRALIIIGNWLTFESSRVILPAQMPTRDDL